MLCLVILSVGSTFAADNSSNLANDELTGGDALAVSDDAQIVSDGETVTPEIVTKDNFNNYFDKNGSLLSNVTAKELTFSGEITDIGVNTIVLDRSIKLSGNNATFGNVAIDVKSSDVIISGLTMNQNNGTYAVSVNDASNVEISDLTINFNAISNEDGYAIKAELANNLKLINNAITYVGSTTYFGINNAVFISNSNAAIIRDNKFDLSLVSAAVAWFEVPAGSGNWVSAPISEGIVIESSSDVDFAENVVDVVYNNISGSYDTIYALSVKDSANAAICSNNITTLGHTYTYAIQVNGKDFNICDNNIVSKSDNYYANGIDIEGPASGVVEDNNITVEAAESSYAIYSGMNGADVSANYTGNKIKGSAYNVFGFSLGDVESYLKANEVTLAGNYTTGVAYRGYHIDLTDNHIVLDSSEQGNESIWEGFGVEAVGVKVIKGAAVIANNTIATAGKGVSLTGNETSTYLTGNFINVVGNTDKDAYAIYAKDISSSFIVSNDIDYQGTTQGTGINNAVYLNNVDNSLIVLNKFDLDLVSSFVPWFEVPAGSGNWVSFPVSEGIVIDESDNVTFAGNNVNVTYGDVVGSYDTIYAVSVKNSDDAVIAGNNITALGHTYIYGVQISGDNFAIEENKITVESDNYYANGIDIEGPASGVVEDNVIDVKAIASAYAIYSGMNGADVSANYTGNKIKGSAYNVFGFSLGDVESYLKANEVTLVGNYTTGVAYRGYHIDLTDNHIVLQSSEQGNESIWEGFGVEAVGVKVIKGAAIMANNTIATAGKGVSLTGNETSAYLTGNFINVVGNTDKDAYAVYVDGVSYLYVVANDVDYQGTTQGNGINNAVYLNNVANSLIVLNKFDLDLVSSYVPWFEVPAGSGNWVSFPVSEGIVVDGSNNVTLVGNSINVTYGDVVGSYDTIYAVDFRNSNDVAIAGNDIVAKGNTYIYGIIISANNFTIDSNNISVVSDYYANGIDIEGPASGVVEDNVIDVKAVTSAYAIYSGMNGADVSANYTGNKISGNAYNIFGFSLGDVESNINGNDVNLAGNYTTGIAYRGSKLTVTDNNISVKGSNVGNESIWEGFGVETVGVKVVLGKATIKNNNILSTGNYTVKVADTVSSVTNNILNAKELYGDNSVEGSENATIKNNYADTSKLVFVKSKTVLLTAIKKGSYYKIILKDSKGNVLAGKKVSITFNGKTTNKTTNEKGLISYKLAATSIGSKKLIMKFAGDDKYAPVSGTATIKITKEATKISAPAKTFKAKVKTKRYTIILKDSKGKVIKNAKVTLKVKGKTYNAVTNSKGKASFKITNLNKKGTFTASIKYNGDKYYKAANKSAKIIVK